MPLRLLFALSVLSLLTVLHPATAWAVDTDGDGLDDAVEEALGTSPGDPDSDGDGIDDFVETDGGLSIDTDGDAVIDALDTDADGDGYGDVVERTVDTDGDGISDYRDTDSDGDAVLDFAEAVGDSDADGLSDRIDSDDDGDGIPTLLEGGPGDDADVDGTPNHLDLDSDGDGFLDGSAGEGTGDLDGDGTPDFLDADTPGGDLDGDGLSDAVELDLGTIPGDPDSDGDGIGDGTETDGGLPVDTDGDGTIDALDPDSDDDGLLDVAEGAEDVDFDGVANYRDLDSDGDGFGDAEEAAAGSDPYDASVTPDEVNDPVIHSVTDVGNDQGRRVRVRWSSSARDVLGSPEPIVSYSLYRRIDAGLAVTPGAVSHRRAAGDWDFVTSVPATTEPAYSTLATTLCDSTDAGVCWSVFFVRAHTATPGVFYDSAPDSGYSTDDLAPNAPASLTVDYGASNVLQWEPSEAEDFRYFRVYRGSAADFEPSAATLAQTTVDPAWTDPSGDRDVFYRVSAVDFAGNEGPAASPATVTAAAPRARTALEANAPNPFNPRTTIAFRLAESGPATLTVYDARGRTVRLLVDGDAMPAGRHEVTWDGRDDEGRGVAGGVYFYALRADDVTLRRSMVLLK